MTDNDTNITNRQQPNESIDCLSREVRALRDTVMHEMDYLRMIASGLSDLRGFTAQIASRQPVDGHPLASAPAANTTRCHACGARLHRHPAQAGVLLLCPTCGWSEFVDRDGTESAELRPDPVPLTAQSPRWPG